MGVPLLARTTSLRVLARLALMGGGPPALLEGEAGVGEDGTAEAARLARALTMGLGPLLVGVVSDEVDVSSLGFFCGVVGVTSSSSRSSGSSSFSLPVSLRLPLPDGRIENSCQESRTSD